MKRGGRRLAARELLRQVVIDRIEVIRPKPHVERVRGHSLLPPHLHPHPQGARRAMFPVGTRCPFAAVSTRRESLRRLRAKWLD